MEYVKFSTNNMDVSRVGLGTWAIGGWQWGGTDEQQAIETIQAAIDAGINLVDTAPVYGFGQSESIVGKALKGQRRKKAIIATKAGLQWDAQENITRNSAKNRIAQEVGDSLKRLQTDYIDIYQIHWPDLRTSFEETASTMLDLYNKGIIRAIGVSNFSIEQMQEWMKYAPLHSIQPPYNLFERDMENNVIQFALDKGISILGYGSLCRGLLSGKYTMDTVFGEGDMRKEDDPKFSKENLPNYLKAVEELKLLAQSKGKSVAQLAVRWLLDRGVTTALWGARSIKQLEPVGGVEGFSLTAEDNAKIDEILKRNIPNPISPVFMAPPV